MSSKHAMAQEEVNTPYLPPPPSYQEAHHIQHLPGSSNNIISAPPPSQASFSPAVPAPAPIPSQPISTAPIISYVPVQQHYTVAESPRQQHDYYDSQNSEMKQSFNGASEFYPPGPANELNRPSSMSAYPPMANPIPFRRDSQYSTYNPQDIYDDNMNKMMTIQEQSTQMPMTSPTVTTYQPRATMPMVADNKNVLEKPRFPNGERGWSYGMCDCCCENYGTCCFACLCPCVVHAKLKSRVSYLERNNYPHPEGGSGCNSECFIHCCLSSLCAIGWVLQIGQRSTIRDRYRIAGGGFQDCMATWCCSSCTLTQESREVALEERALGGNERSLRLD